VGRDCLKLYVVAPLLTLPKEKLYTPANCALPLPCAHRTALPFAAPLRPTSVACYILRGLLSADLSGSFMPSFIFFIALLADGILHGDAPSIPAVVRLALCDCLLFLVPSTNLRRGRVDGVPARCRARPSPAGLCCCTRSDSHYTRDLFFVTFLANVCGHSRMAAFTSLCHHASSWQHDHCHLQLY